MEHTQAKIMLLRGAKQIIASGREQFACLAIKQAADECGLAMPKSQASTVANMLVEDIMCVIRQAGAGVITVDSWLRKTVPEYKAWFEKCKEHGGGSAFTNPEYIREMRAYRLRWLDAMIKDLKL
jgi:hypothetical protein